MTPKPFFGAARAFTDVALGGPTTDQDSTVAVTTSASLLLGKNPDRVGLLIINVGSNQTFLGLTSGVANNAGIQLPANGGNFICNVRDDFTLPSRDFYGISIGGVSTIYVLEIIRLTYTPAAEK